jgi:hypothetical protein
MQLEAARAAAAGLVELMAGWRFRVRDLASPILLLELEARVELLTGGFGEHWSDRASCV